MFLTYLSDFNEDEKYWPFVFRLETVLAGIIREGCQKLASDGENSRDQAYLFLFDALGACLDSHNNLFPPGWWPEPIPSIEWFDAYLHRELDAMIVEARRLAALPPEDLNALKNREDSSSETPETASAPAYSPMNKQKVRELAHLNPVFRNFILPFADPDANHADHSDHAHHSDHACRDDCCGHSHSEHP